jgi:hypothetical protein
MVKRNSCGKALEAARASRDMLGNYNIFLNSKFFKS